MGIIFLFFRFSQKACLNFEKKKLFFRLILKYSSFVYFSSGTECIFAAPELEWPGRKAIEVRLAFEGFSLASFLSYVQVKANTKECLSDKSSSPHNCHSSFSSLKTSTLDSEYIFNNTRSGASIDSKLTYFPLNLHEIFYNLKWSYLFYLRHRIVEVQSCLVILCFFAPQNTAL